MKKGIYIIAAVHCARGYDNIVIQYIVPNLYISAEKPNIAIADVKLAVIEIPTGNIYLIESIRIKW